MAFQIKDHNLISELQQRYLECNVCTEIFNENDRIPKILPCQHSFCLVCLNAIYRKDKIKCPTCNCLHTLNKREFRELPKDNIRRDLKSFLQIQGINSQVCSSCRSDKNNFVCKTCDQYLCTDCCRLHRGKFSSHEVIRVNKIKHAEEDGSDVCLISGHDDSPLKYFCNAVFCKKIICANCAILDHRDTDKHAVIELKHVFEKRKESLRSAVSSLREHVQSVKVKETSFVQHGVALNNRKKEFTKKVEITVEKGIKLLNDRKIQLIENCSKLFQHRGQIISNFEVKSKHFIENAEECCNISEQILLSTSIGSILTIDEMLIARITELLDTKFEDIEQEDDSRFQLMDNQILKIENVLKKLEEKPVKVRPDSSFLKNRVLQSTKKLLFLLPISFILSCTRGVRQQGTKLHNFWFQHNEPESFGKKLKSACKFCLMCCILIAITYMPGDILIPKTLFADLKFDTTQRSQFACRSPDNKTVSSFPDNPRMICGSPNMLFKYKGVFGTKQFLPLKSENVHLMVQFREYFSNDEDYNRTVLFEFGLTPSRPDANYAIQQEALFIASAYSCRLNTFAVCLKIADRLFMTDHLFINGKTSNSLTGLFGIHIRPKKASVSFTVKTFGNALLHKFTDIVFDKPLIPVFAAYEKEKISVSMTIMSKNSMQFDRTTLHQHLYISDDNKTFSNRPISNTRLNKTIKNPYVHSASYSVGSFTHVFAIVEISFADSTNFENGTRLFDLGFGYETNSEFIESIKFECFVCKVIYYRIFRGIGYCLYNKNTQSIFEGKLRIIIHYQIVGNKLSMYIPNTMGGISYYAYTFKSFGGMIPQLFIKKHNVEDISVSFTSNIYIFEAVMLYSYEMLYSLATFLFV